MLYSISHRICSRFGFILLCGYTIIFNACDKFTPFVTAARLAPGQTHGFAKLNTLRSRQYDRRFADDIFKCIFLNEDIWISINISMKFVPKDPIDNIPILFQTMAWRRPGDKPLSEPMVVSLLMHICVTRPQWVNKNKDNWTTRASFH